MSVMENKLNHNSVINPKVKHTTKIKCINTIKITNIIGALQHASKYYVKTGYFSTR